MSFLSPITPSSTLRQSLPAGYFTVFAEGRTRLNVYSDINGEWLSGNADNKIRWSLSGITQSSHPSSSKSWQVERDSQQLLTEIGDRSEWGTLFFTGPASGSHQAGSAATLRQRFAETGELSGDVNPDFRSINDNEPAFAFSTRLNTSASNNITAAQFTIALVQDPVVQFASARGLTMMRPLWASYIPDAFDMVKFHYDDFHATSLLATNYSRHLSRDARSTGSPGYEDIVSLSARQVMGATQFSGTPENPILFLKEISSNGNFQTVDVIFPSFPFFLYTNPRWLAFLLEPLIEHQLSGQYPNNYSMHDLGSHFPNATGHIDGNDEYMPVEECGNMLIMGLSVVHALKSGAGSQWSRSISHTSPAWNVDQMKRQHGDSIGLAVDAQGLDIIPAKSGDSVPREWVKRAYGLWKQWTGYLVKESLIPRNQLSTDDFAGRLANQTNLALKGIIGIRAMSELSEIVGEHADAKDYRNISDTYIDKWQELGLSRDRTHAKLAYTWYGSWTTLYNLFADALLCFHLPSHGRSEDDEHQAITTIRRAHGFVPNAVYKMQSQWYSFVIQRYGLPLDSRHLYTKSDWAFFAAAVASKKTRGAIIESTARWINETTTGTRDGMPPHSRHVTNARAADRPLTDLYDTEGSGDFPDARFMARPVVGGHFAILALGQACHGKAFTGLQFLDPDFDYDASVRLDDARGHQNQDVLMEL